MRTLFFGIILAAALSAQTSTFPGSLDTDSQLFSTADNVQTTLTRAMLAGDGVAIVASSAGWQPNMVATVCDAVNTNNVCTLWEHMLVTAVATNVLTVTRGVGGTSAAAHVTGRFVSALVDSLHQKALSSAVKAIEGSLGANLVNIPNLAKSAQTPWYGGTFNNTKYQGPVFSMGAAMSPTLQGPNTQDAMAATMVIPLNSVTGGAIPAGNAGQAIAGYGQTLDARTGVAGGFFAGISSDPGRTGGSAWGINGAAGSNGSAGGDILFAAEFNINSNNTNAAQAAGVWTTGASQFQVSPASSGIYAGVSAGYWLGRFGYPESGTVTCNNTTTVTWQSGRQFDVNWNRGNNLVRIANVTYTISAIGSGTSLTLTGTCPSGSSLAYTMDTDIPWVYGIKTEDGSSVYGLWLGAAQNVGTYGIYSNSPSQQIVLNSRTSGIAYNNQIQAGVASTLQVYLPVGLQGLAQSNNRQGWFFDPLNEIDTWGDPVTAHSVTHQFLTGGFNNTYDSRIVASGGTNGSNGQGVLAITASAVGINMSNTPSWPLDVQATVNAAGVRVTGRASDNIGSVAFTNNSQSIQALLYGNGTAFNFGGTAFSGQFLTVTTPSQQTSDGIRVTSTGDGHFLIASSSTSNGSYNNFTQVGDHMIMFTDGSPGTGNLVIGPWMNSAVGGLRINSSGNVTFSGSIVIGSANYIAKASETGAINAIAGSVPGLVQADGVCVNITLAHTLQGAAGGNTFALNGGTARAIIQSSNGANLTVAYAVNSKVDLCYSAETTAWMDMRQ
jgi:hypothetical protein